MFVSNCVKCGGPIEREEIFPLFKIKILKEKTKQSDAYRGVILCDECQDSLWRWIYCEEKED